MILYPKILQMSNKLNIGFWNTQCIKSSYIDLINNKPFDLLFLSETWLNKKDKTQLTKNYKEILKVS